MKQCKDYYQKQCENIIENLDAHNKLLIHSCCAPCSSYVLEYLSKYFQITVLYYNPNIFPIDEYNYRIEEQDRLIKAIMNEYKRPDGNDKEHSIIPLYPVSFVAVPYKPEDFYSSIKGHEDDSEGGERCTICYKLRLEYAAKYAKKHDFDYFTTTLSISPLKDAERLNNIGQELEKIYEVKYLYSDFKKKNGYKRSTELSKEYELYRQSYCGCIYSKRERYRIKENL